MDGLSQRCVKVHTVKMAETLGIYKGRGAANAKIGVNIGAIDNRSQLEVRLQSRPRRTTRGVMGFIPSAI
jgi:hypothetical protein